MSEVPQNPQFDQLNYSLLPQVDPLSKLLFYCSIISALIQLAYLVSPDFLKKKFERLDYDKEYVNRAKEQNFPLALTQRFQTSSIIAFLSLIFVMLFLIQAQDFERFKLFSKGETAEQKNFRQRQQWTSQGYMQRAGITCAIWFGIKIQTQINRKHEKILNEISRLN